MNKAGFKFYCLFIKNDGGFVFKQRFPVHENHQRLVLRAFH